jgi:O-acetyl-ADP-ribose deacetylase (regulator of RNase III)
MSEPILRPFGYRFGPSTLRVDYCDITTLNVDAMVSSDDVNLSMAGGVSQALLRGGGETVWRDAQSKAPIRWAMSRLQRPVG